MENFDVNAVKELYTELKIKNYEKEKELRTLIKLKEKFPPAAKEEKWINKYRSLMSSIAEEIECFKKLKTVLSKEEMELLAYDVQCDIFKKIYYANNLDRFELQKEDIPAEQYNIENTGYIYVDGVCIVDLTVSFGAGNEPDLSWCNANIDYFDGSIVVYK